MANKVFEIGSRCALGVIVTFIIYIASNSTRHAWNTAFASRGNEEGTSRKFPQSNKTSFGSIMIGIKLTDCMGYTEFTASIIKTFHDINDKDVHVFTNQAFDYDNSRLTRWYGKNISIIRPMSLKSSTIEMLETFVSSEYKILLLVDSNMVFLPGWRDFITKHMIGNNSAFLSLYHSARMHNYTSDCPKYVGDLCVGPIQSKLGIAVTKDLAETILRKHSRLLDNYDWNEILAEENVAAIYPTKSLVMMIGQTNQDENFCGENEVPYGFKLCEFPDWIRNGIVFYFDRCTNPQEIFSTEISLQRANNEHRQWCRPAISYSLYGNNPRYTKPALENSKRVFSIYPGWKIWIYIDNTVSKELIDRLCENNVRFVNMTGTDIQNKMSWRFLIASESVKMYAVRDIDSNLISRGKAAVDEWIKAGRKFHVMRDHPNHSAYAMSGGMWGGTRDAIPNMAELIKNYRAGNGYFADMSFLIQVVWKIAKKSVWAHDSFPLHKFGESHDFPTRRDPRNFVGKVAKNNA